MDTITILLVCGAFAGLVAQYLIKEAPFYLMSELLALGGLVTSLNEYTNGSIEEAPALVLIIAMVSIMVFSSWNLIAEYLPTGKRKRF